jgi:nucleoid-associated protein YgaU
VVVAAVVLILGGVALLNIRSVVAPEVDESASTLAPATRPAGSVGAGSPSALAMEATRRHVVASGDTLRSIAEGVYGDETLWRLIYEANRGVISDPESLRVGQSLVIPLR